MSHFAGTGNSAVSKGNIVSVLMGWKSERISGRFLKSGRKVWKGCLKTRRSWRKVEEGWVSRVYREAISD